MPQSLRFVSLRSDGGWFKGAHPLKKPRVALYPKPLVMANRKQSKRLVRKHLFSLRLSDIELDLLRIKSLDAGMSASELMRRNGLLRPLPKRLSKISLQTYWELGQVDYQTERDDEPINELLLKPVKPLPVEQLEKLFQEIERKQQQPQFTPPPEDKVVWQVLHKYLSEKRYIPDYISQGLHPTFRTLTVTSSLVLN